MTRVRYLAALAGASERRPAPPLRPPRRLFPHEPPPIEPLSQPAAEAAGDPSTPAQPTVRSEPARSRHEPADGEARVVSSVPERRRDVPVAPPRAPRFEEVRRPPVEEVPSPPEPEPVAQALPARKPAAAAEHRATTREVEPERTEVARRRATRLEPSRLGQFSDSPSGRAPAAQPHVVTPARAPGLHIGSIDVTVVPAPAAPREPALPAPPAPVHRPSAPFAPRGTSMSRWFGLAQR